MAGHLIASIPVEKEGTILLAYFIVQISIVQGIDQQTRYKQIKQDKAIPRAKMQKGGLLLWNKEIV